MLQSLRSVVTSLAIASVIGSAAQAYTSTSTQAYTARAQISTAGVAVRAVDYESSGAMLQAVTFRVSNPNVSVSIRLRDDGQWISCANSAGAVRCETPNFPASAVEQLEVTAS
jgi:Cu/Ag efflux protein CusF